MQKAHQSVFLSQFNEPMGTKNTLAFTSDRLFAELIQLFPAGLIKGCEVKPECIVMGCTALRMHPSCNF
jgi:hypothetical protein